MQGKRQLSIAALAVLAILCITPGKAQIIGGKVILLDRLTEVGRPFKVKMEIFHPEKVPVIFPDSTFGLGGMEYIKQDLYPTQTADGRSFDQTVYYFYTWDIAEKQAINLPFKYVVDGDTLIGQAELDSLEVKPAIANMSDTLQLKMIAGLEEVSEPVSKLSVTIFILALIGLIVGGLLLLNKPLRKRFMTWRLDREWQKILEQLQGLKPQVQPQVEFIAGLNNIWKNYLQTNNNRALRTLTTTELRRELEKGGFEKMQEFEKEALMRAAHSGDRILYASQELETTDLETLQTDILHILEAAYQRKKSEVLS